MPTKKGAGGRLQNYDPRTGRFAKTDYAKLYPPREPTRKEKARKREAIRREILFNRAKNSRDPLVFDVFCEIEQNLPGSVQAVNEEKYDPYINGTRELDIITKKCIIEVKSGKVAHKLFQFQSQKRFAFEKKKNHIVFAPDIHNPTKRDYEKNGIVVKCSLPELIQTIKEYEK